MKREDIIALIIDDDKPEVRFITECLVKEGLLASNIISTDDARDGVAMTKVHEPHIIFADGFLSSSGTDKGDGFLMLKEIHEIYKDDVNYKPFTAAISNQMSIEIQKSIENYCTIPLSKHQRNYPFVALNRFLMVHGESFHHPKTDIDETDYMRKVHSLIKEELAPFNYSELSKMQKRYVIELICLFIPKVDKSFVSINSLYKVMAKNFGVQNVKSTVNRAFQIFLETENFLELYDGDYSNNKPPQREFFEHIASNVKKKL